MVSAAEWFRIVKAYSTTIWPTQIVLYIAAVLVTGWFLLKHDRASNIIMKLYFVIAFAWNGIMWFFVFAKDMAGDSYGNYFFGAVFMVVSVLFAVDIFRQKTPFVIPADGWQKRVTLTLMLLVFCYPLLGVVLGHDSSRLMYPGTYPCPTTALAIVLLTAATPQVDKVVFFLLLFLAIPFTPFIQILRYGVYEDVILFVSGVYGLIFYLRVR